MRGYYVESLELGSSHQQQCTSQVPYQHMLKVTSCTCSGFGMRLLVEGEAVSNQRVVLHVSGMLLSGMRLSHIFVSRNLVSHIVWL